MDPKILSRIEDMILRASVYSDKQPCRVKWFDITLGCGTGLSANEYIPLDVKPSDLDAPLNWSALFWFLDDQGEISQQSGLAIIHARAATRFDLAGLPFRPNCYSLSVYDTDAKLPIIRTVAQYAPNGSSNFRCYRDSNDRSRIDEVERMMRVSMGLQFAGYFNWNVDIGIDGSPAVRFPCDAENLKEVFKMRDVPESQRRDAILHWVRSHKRTIKAGTPDERCIDVVQHLRGCYDFGWKGLNVRVYPSRYDLKRLAPTKTAKAISNHAEVAIP